MVFHKHIHIIIILFFSINLFGQDESYNKHLYDGNINYDKDFLLAENSYRKEEELYDEALIRQAEALKNAKSNNEKHRINHNIGNILMKKDLCKEALEAYKNALRNNPNDDETRYNLSLAKLCADQQKDDQKKDDQKKDDQQKDDQKKDDQKKDDQKKDDQQKDDQQKDDQQNDKKNNPSKDRGSAKLSPEQIKNLLKAMNNEENKVQAKINENKQKGVKIVTEKDW